MRSKFLASALSMTALVLASPSPASVTEFRLPSERPQQAPPPDVEGPVAPDVPASRRVRAAPTPTPSASREEPPAPASAAPPVEVPAGLQAAPATSATGRAANPARAPVATAAAPETAASEPAATPASDGPRASPAPPAAASATGAQTEPSGWSWLWLLGLPILLGTAVFVVRAVGNRSRRPVAQAAAPLVERPRAAPAPAGAPAALPSAAHGEPLQLSLEPLRLALTLMNATLAYRLELANRGPTAVIGLAIGADMISAHASMSREEQLSGPRAGNGSAAAPLQRFDRLEPGESRVIEGEFRLPLPQIVPIRQGSAALMVPLARFRVEAEGAAPIVRTFAIGQPGQGNGLQPFRLDQGPRIYPRLTQHAFA